MSDPFLFYLAAVPAVTLQGLAKGGFAGVALLSTPLVALVVPPVQAAGILLPILICQDVVSVWAFRRTWDRTNLVHMLPGAVLGILIGWLLAAHVTDAEVKLAVGLIACVFTLNHWLAPRLRRTEPAPTRAAPLGGAIWGTLAGFTSFLSHTGAPPFQVHVLPQRLPKEVYAGTTTMFFAATNLMKTVPYVALGQLDRANLATAATLFPVALLSTLAGVWLVRRVPTVLFYRIAYALVFVVSLKLIWDGVAGLAG